MDALFLTPLETSVSRLIEEHLRTLLSRFESFSSFTASTNVTFNMFSFLPFFV